MRVLSVNVGQPSLHEWHGQSARSAIFKHPVEGPVKVRRLNLDGDGQADLQVHGGPEKAVYLYPYEHYAWWRKQLGDYPLTPGNFGENLTVGDADEAVLYVGDELEIGTARFRAVQPRTPCWKLGLRFGRDDMTRLFFDSRRFGLYLSVLREGELQAGDEVRVVAKDPAGLSIADLVALFTGDNRSTRLFERAFAAQHLPEAWRQWLEHIESQAGNLSKA